MNKSLAILCTAFFLATAATACSGTGSAPSVTAEPSATATETPLTALQEHIKEDALELLKADSYSKVGVIEHLTREYTDNDVKTAVGTISCEVDWLTEAAGKAETYGVTDKAEIKRLLVEDGFSTEEAEYGANPVPQS